MQDLQELLFKNITTMTVRTLGQGSLNKRKTAKVILACFFKIITISVGNSSFLARARCFRVSKLTDV